MRKKQPEASSGSSSWKPVIAQGSLRQKWPGGWAYLKPRWPASRSEATMLTPLILCADTFKRWASNFPWRSGSVSHLVLAILDPRLLVLADPSDLLRGPHAAVGSTATARR